MKCEMCNGKKRQRTRKYEVFNTILNQVVKKFVLCDSCAFPLLYAQVKMEGERKRIDVVEIMDRMDRLDSEGEKS